MRRRKWRKGRRVSRRWRKRRVRKRRGQDEDGSERDQKLIDDARLGQSLLSPDSYQLVRILR